MWVNSYSSNDAFRNIHVIFFFIIYWISFKYKISHNKESHEFTWENHLRFNKMHSFEMISNQEPSFFICFFVVVFYVGYFQMIYILPFQFHCGDVRRRIKPVYRWISLYDVCASNRLIPNSIISNFSFHLTGILHF